MPGVVRHTKEEKESRTEVPSRACFELAADPSALKERLRAALGSYAGLEAYRSLLERADTQRPDISACTGLQRLLADRAYDAETNMRRLVKYGLDTLNELRDTGQLPTLLNEFQDLGSAGLLERKLSQAKDLVTKAYPGVPTSYLDEAFKFVKQQEVRIHTKDENIVFSMKAPDGSNPHVAISPGGMPGAPARVDVADFFGARPDAIIGSGSSVFAPNNCHHRHLIEIGATRVPLVDLYGGTLAGFSTANQMMYQHARKVDEVGHGVLHGRCPVTIIAAVIVAVGVVLVVVGAVAAAEGQSWGWGLIGLGLVVIAGGICVGVGACSFIVQGITIIQA